MRYGVASAGVRVDRGLDGLDDETRTCRRLRGKRCEAGWSDARCERRVRRGGEKSNGIPAPVGVSSVSPVSSGCSRSSPGFYPFFFWLLYRFEKRGLLIVARQSV